LESANVQKLAKGKTNEKSRQFIIRTVASLFATVKQQPAQLQKVSVQLDWSKPAPQTVANR
jgi:hypothetical protein